MHCGPARRRAPANDDPDFALPRRTIRLSRRLELAADAKSAEIWVPVYEGHARTVGHPTTPGTD
jgi:hypothetical protein